MALIKPRTNEKHILIIFNLIRGDCIELNAKFHNNRRSLNNIIKVYEEFIFGEINSIFRVNDEFSGIVRSHRRNFAEFLANNCGSSTKGHVDSTQDQSKICLHVSIQEWLLQGQRGQQFQYLVDIDCLSYPQEAQAGANLTEQNGNGFETVDSGYSSRAAKLSATSYAHRSILLFDGQTLVNHTNADKRVIEKMLRYQS